MPLRSEAHNVRVEGSEVGGVVVGEEVVLVHQVRHGRLKRLRLHAQHLLEHHRVLWNRTQDDLAAVLEQQTRRLGVLRPHLDGHERRVDHHAVELVVQLGIHLRRLVVVPVHKVGMVAPLQVHLQKNGCHYR